MSAGLTGLGTQRRVVVYLSRMLSESASRKRFVSREICVPFRPGGRAPVGRRRGFGKRPAVPESLHEVGVADKGSPKGNQIGESFGNRFLCRFLGVAAVAHEWAVEDLAELGQCHRLAEIVGAECQPIDDVQIRQTEAIELTGAECELLPEMQRGTVGSFRNCILLNPLRQNRLKVRFPPPPLVQIPLSCKIYRD
jgi:hypothetical protein